MCVFQNYYFLIFLYLILSTQFHSTAQKRGGYFAQINCTTDSQNEKERSKHVLFNLSKHVFFNLLQGLMD